MTKIELLRRMRGWKQMELAKAAGIDRSTICQLERCIRKPYPKARQRLSAALGVSESDLFRLDGWPIEIDESSLR